MPAPSLADLYAIERNVSAAAATIMGSALSLPAYSLFSDALKNRPRIECHVAEVSRASDQAVFDYAGRPRYCHYSGQLRVRLCVLRSETPAPEHARLVALIRAQLDPALQRFTAPALPYYEILSLEETGTAPDVSDEEDIDITEMTIAFELGIPPEAFPELSAG